MKGLMITGIIGLVFFGGAYAYSTMQLAQQKAEQETEEDDPLEKPQEIETGDKSIHDADGTGPIPVPFPAKSMTETAILEMAESLRKREKVLKAREQELNRREQKMQDILNDIQYEKREFEAVVHRAQTKVIESQKILQMIEVKKKSIEADLKKLEQIRKADGTLGAVHNNAANVQIAKLLESNTPEELAKMLTELANSGKLEEAGNYLNLMEGRYAAKALSAINDPKLRIQILDAIKIAKSKSLDVKR